MVVGAALEEGLAGVGVEPQLTPTRSISSAQVGAQHAHPVVAAHAQDEAVRSGVGPREARVEEGVVRGVAGTEERERGSESTGGREEKRKKEKKRKIEKDKKRSLEVGPKLTA